MIEKSRSMKDITLQEISYVDKPANKRGFLLFKRDGKSSGDSFLKAKKKIKIEIESDGTKKGTTITVNGDKITGMKSFNFSVWSESTDDAAVSCSYSKLVESEGGFQRTESYYLAKGDVPMDKRLEKLLKQLFGDKEVKLEKSELNEKTIVELEKALTTINEYREDMPSDLIAAIGLAAIHAGQGYKEPEPVEKAGAKLSKDTVAKLKSIIEAATAMLPKEKDGNDDGTTQKSDDNTTELQKTIKALSKSMADITGKLEKKEATDQLTQITEAIGKVSDRLKVIEKKPASTKKSIDDDPTKKKEVQKDSQGREIGHWPSLTGEADENKEE